MWTYSQLGFWSTVATQDADVLAVRGRDKRDMRRLQMLLVVLGNDMPEILGGVGSDYPFRILVARSAFADVMGTLATHLQYANFKAEVEAVQGISRARLYSRLWAVTRELEEVGEDD